ncbi:MAG: hypothetical protein R2909_14050 [Gemmatimonadales bacterium]
MTRHHHSYLRETIVTGALGAGAVALWFLVMDVLDGLALVTPSVLGQVILFGETEPILSRVVWPAVLAYSVVHLIGFLLFAAVVTRLVFLADRSQLALFALFMLFVAFEGFFSGLMAMLFAGTAGLFPFWKVIGANSFALVAMGWYLLPRHPAIRRRLAREPLGG